MDHFIEKFTVQPIYAMEFSNHLKLLQLIKFCHKNDDVNMQIFHSFSTKRKIFHFLHKQKYFIICKKKNILISSKRKIFHFLQKVNPQKLLHVHTTAQEIFQHTRK